MEIQEIFHLNTHACTKIVLYEDKNSPKNKTGNFLRTMKLNNKKNYVNNNEQTICSNSGVYLKKLTHRVENCHLWR